MRILLAGLLAVSPVWPQMAGSHRAFVVCPEIRDTKTSPCWLAEYSGETYFLGIQGGVAEDFYPPQLEHQVLVEGEVVAGPRPSACSPGRPSKVVTPSSQPRATLAFWPSQAAAASSSVAVVTSIASPSLCPSPAW